MKGAAAAGIIFQHQASSRDASRESVIPLNSLATEFPKSVNIAKLQIGASYDGEGAHDNKWAWVLSPTDWCHLFRMIVVAEKHGPSEFPGLLMCC